MKVGLVSVDSKIPNLVLMKLSAYHKARGDTVYLYDPAGEQPDLIYGSKVFDFTLDYPYPEGIPVIKGGTGYDLHCSLPDEIETLYPDYDLFDCNAYTYPRRKLLGTFAMGFTSRGCIRNCPFCVVPRKEGKARAVADIDQFWRGQSHLMIMDNNLTALPEHFERITKQVIATRVYVDFCQGLDIRLITPEMAQLLAKVRLWKQIHFAFDNMSDEVAFRRGMQILQDNGVKPYKIAVYVLIGYNTTHEENLYRVNLIKDMGADPFAMPFDKKDPYQKDFTRWVNQRAVFQSTTWEEYKRPRGQIQALGVMT